jgi:hypothetical protein
LVNSTPFCDPAIRIFIPVTAIIPWGMNSRCDQKYHDKFNDRSFNKQA